MVLGLSSRLALHHQLSIDEAAVKLAVDLSQRYVMDRFLPDKAIDVLDEAAALMRSKQPLKPGRRQKIAQQIKRLAGKIDAAVEAEDYERAARFKTQMKQLEKRAGDLGASEDMLPRLDEAYLRSAVSAMTGVPVKKLAHTEARSLIKLENRLGNFVLGQTEAIAELARSIRRNSAGLNRHSGPMGSFVFLGPTGVGKTELARVLAREVFGGEQSLIKIDMSEFSEKHTTSRLVGAPAGYVGYEEGGKLTDKVCRQPYSVVLFDEIEKAHPDVMNLLLQLLEDGQLTDAQGRVVSFRHTIIILTSNVGSAGMMNSEALGFGGAKKRSSKDVQQHNDRTARQALEDFLKPELIERFDAIIVFQALSRAVAGKIFDTIASELGAAIESHGMNLMIKPSVKRHIIDHGFDTERGARRLRRTVQTLLGDPLSEAVLSKAQTGSTLIASMKKGEVIIDVED